MAKELTTTIKYIFSSEGKNALPLLLNRGLNYLYYKYILKGEFKLNDKSYKYFYHWYNVTFRNERCIEIPLAIEILKSFEGTDKEILEVGNVLTHYINNNHEVVDKYEEAFNTIKEDIVTFNPSKRYDLIISLSTLEHVGWDETPKEKDKFVKAIGVMLSLLKPNGKLFITMPFGWSEDVDNYIWDKRYGTLKASFLKRVDEQNRWKQVNYDETKEFKYNTPYPNANGLIVLEN